MKLPILFIAAIAAYLCSVLVPSGISNWIISAVSLLIVIVVFRYVKRFVMGLGS